MESKKRLFWARGEYDFQSTSPDLSFKEGDLLYITDVSQTNWWEATNINDETGTIPSNYVSVLPQYSTSPMQASSSILTISVEAHESSAQAIIISATTESPGSEGEGGSEGVTHTNVKTISNVLHFTKELSKFFPEAGLPLKIEEDYSWSNLLKAGELATPPRSVKHFSTHPFKFN